MKIGFVYDAVYPWIKGGGEKTLFELACALRDRGHECHLFGMHLWEGPADVTRDGLHYHAICPNIPLYSPNGKRSLWQPVRFAWGILTRLRRYEPETFDIFDVHAFPFFSVPTFQLARWCRFRRVPWLLTWLEVWGRRYWRNYIGVGGDVGALLERWCAAVAPHHLCISPTTGRRLHELLGTSAADITVIPRGFQPPNTADLARFAKPRDPNKVVVAGRLLDHKRIDVAIRAWSTVRVALPQAELHIIGDGPEIKNLLDLADALRVRGGAGGAGGAGGVHFRGQLAEREQVLAEIASASLLLQTSRREGQSIVVLEALMLGTPVLAATGPETAVGDFLSGDAMAQLDVAAGPDQWAARIVHLLTHEGSRAKLAEMGMREVSALDWERDIAPRVEQLYTSLLAKSAQR